MKGKPKYKLDDIVSFKILYDNEEKTFKGKVYIVDANGTFDNPTDASYDILVDNSPHYVSVGYGDGKVHKELREGPCLYKHITESLIIKKHRK